MRYILHLIILSSTDKLSQSVPRTSGIGHEGGLGPGIIYIGPMHEWQKWYTSLLWLHLYLYLHSRIVIAIYKQQGWHTLHWWSHCQLCGLLGEKKRFLGGHQAQIEWKPKLKSEAKLSWAFEQCPGRVIFLHHVYIFLCLYAMPPHSSCNISASFIQTKPCAHAAWSLSRRVEVLF